MIQPIEWFLDRVDAYVNGELSEAECKAFEEAEEAYPELKAEIAFQTRLKEVLLMQRFENISSPLSAEGSNQPTKQANPDRNWTLFILIFVCLVISLLGWQYVQNYYDASSSEQTTYLATYLPADAFPSLYPICKDNHRAMGAASSKPCKEIRDLREKNAYEKIPQRLEDFAINDSAGSVYVQFLKGVCYLSENPAQAIKELQAVEKAQDSLPDVARADFYYYLGVAFGLPGETQEIAQAQELLTQYVQLEGNNKKNLLVPLAEKLREHLKTIANP